MDIPTKVDEAIKASTGSASYGKDNLLCYSVSLQPHFLVWASSLVLSSGISEATRAICKENAEEEIFGLKDEGCHFLLSRDFFRQVGTIEGKHYSQTEKEVENIYKHIKNPKVIITILTCIEMGLAQVVLPKILESMKNLGVTNFYYIDVHTDADNTESGHSVKFLEALTAENPTEEELNLGLSLFINLFQKMFQSAN